jgi:transaldolase
MTDQLTALKALTTVVADSGDLGSFQDLKPQDATTNPSLILAAAQMDQYKELVASSIDYAKAKASTEDEQVALALDKLAVTFGNEILKIIPGRVSTELDARLSYDTEATIAKCRQLLAMYEGIFASGLFGDCFRNWCESQGTCSFQSCQHMGGYSSC